MKNNFIPIIILLFIISLFIRIYGINYSPTSLGFDEAALGYNAYSILNTGRDEYSKLFPLSLRSFDDYKPALYSYLAIPGIKLLGLSQFSTRLPSAIAGALSVVVWFLLFRKIFPKQSNISALFISLFISMMPWRLHFSRIASESNISMLFYSIVIYLLILLKEGRRHYLLLVFCSVLAIYSYHSSRLAIPILLFLSILDPLGRTLFDLIKDRRRIIICLLVLIAILGLSLPIILENGSNVLNRFSQTNVFAKYYPFAPKEILDKSNLFYITNSPLYYLGGDLVGRSFAYLSPRNLTITGYHWIQKSAMTIIDNGMLGFLGASLFIVGFVGLLKGINKFNIRLLIYGITSAALPAAITWEWYQPFRALNLFPLLDIIVSIGLVIIFLNIKSKPKLLSYLLILSFVIVLVTSSLFNINNEFNYSLWYNNGEFQPGGFKEGSPLLSSLYDKYPIVYVDTPQAQSYILFMTYMKLDPKVIQSTDRIYQNMDGFSTPVFNFGKFVYKKYSWPSDKYLSNFIYWTSSEVKEDGINEVPGAKLYKIYNQFGSWTTSIITKD